MSTKTLMLFALAVLGPQLLGVQDPMISPATAQPLANVTAFSQDWAVIEPGVTLTRQPRAIALCDDGDDPPDADVYIVDAVPWQGSTAVPWLIAEGAVYAMSPKLIEADDTTAPCIIAIY